MTATSFEMAFVNLSSIRGLFIFPATLNVCFVLSYGRGSQFAGKWSDIPTRTEDQHRRAATQPQIEFSFHDNNDMDPEGVKL
jgi:hypothetical protein